MDAQVIPIKPPTLNAMVEQTKAAWDRADAKQSDADEWKIRTGKLLVALKKKVKDEGEQWLPTLKKIGRSQRSANDLMRLAEGDITIEQHNEQNRKAVKKHRAKKKSALRNAKNGNPIVTPEPKLPDDADEDQVEEFWQNSLANICGEVIAREPYFDKQFPGWREFKCPSHIKKLLREAATALTSLSATIGR